jgi:shikimate kinase
MTDNQSYNIYLVGPMGAGKTSIGRQLARKLNLKFYDSDQVIEERTGADIPWIYDIEGENGFQNREIKVIAELTKLRGILLATGGGTVASSENRHALVNNGIIVYLKTSLNDQMERIRYSKKRPLATENTERRDFLKILRIEREPFYEQLANITCNTDGKMLRSVVTEILQELIEKYQIES